MTILISHRGNISGPSLFENQPSHILSAIRAGYECEVDMWFFQGKWYLGHDGPTYQVSIEFFDFQGLWIHCKNVEALNELISMAVEVPLNFFWHQQDDVALTSQGYLWTYPGKELTIFSIAVMPELTKNWDVSKAVGICSDYIKGYKDEE